MEIGLPTTRAQRARFSAFLPSPTLTLATSVHITFGLPSVVGISMETTHPSPSSGPIALACQEC